MRYKISKEKDGKIKPKYLLGFNLALKEVYYKKKNLFVGEAN